MRPQDLLQLAYKFSLTDRLTVGAVKSILIPELWEYRKSRRKAARLLGGERWESEAREATNALKAAINRLRMVK